jgi:hypothetical protein
MFHSADNHSVLCNRPLQKYFFRSLSVRSTSGNKIETDALVSFHSQYSRNRMSLTLAQYLALCLYFTFFYEGPSHHSLKAFCATPMKMMSSFFFYQFFTINGAPVE